MKKLLFLGVLLMGLFAVTAALIPTEQPICSYEQVETTLDVATPVIYQASVFQTILEWIKQLDLSSIIALLLAGGGISVFTSIKKAKNEIMDVVHTYKEVMADKKITPEEAELLIKELEEALTASTKTWYLITGIFKKKKTK